MSHSDKRDLDKGLDKALVLFLMLFFLLSLMIPHGSYPEPVPYSTFIDQLEAGDIASVEVSTDRIVYTLKDQAITYDTSHSESLAQTLVEQEVLEGPELRRYLSQAQLPRELNLWLQGDQEISESSHCSTLAPIPH